MPARARQAAPRILHPGLAAPPCCHIKSFVHAIPTSECRL